LENPKSKKDRDELIVAIDTGYFGDMTRENKNEFIAFLDRLTSDDTRKRTRAISKKKEFEKYEELLNKQKNIIENRMFDLQSKISLDHSPVAKEVLSSL
jgi:hypothetical protein